MRKLLLAAGSSLLVLAFFINLVSGVNIGACDTLGTPNTAYTLTANLTFIDANPGAGKTCMNVTAVNVTLDCNGFWISGNKSNNVYAVNLSNETATVMRCNFLNFSSAIVLAVANHSMVSNNSFYNNTYAITYLNGYAMGSRNVSIRSNFFNASGAVGNDGGSIYLINVVNPLLNVSYNNFTYDNGNAVWNNGTNSTVAGNNFTNVSRAAVLLDTADYSNVTSNVIANSSNLPSAGSTYGSIVFTASLFANASYNNVSQGVNGILLSSASTAGLIAFNRISFTNSTGAFVLNSVNATVFNNTIFNITNTTANSATNAIFFSGASGGNASYNNVQNVSSAGLQIATSSNTSATNNYFNGFGSIALGQGRPVSAVFITGSQYVNFSYNNISNATTGVYVSQGQAPSSGANYSSVLFNRVSFMSNYGIAALGGIGLNISNNTIFNISNYSSGVQSAGIAVTNANASNFYYNVVSNISSNSTSAGILSTGATQNNSFVANALTSQGVAFNASSAIAGLVVYLNNFTSSTAYGFWLSRTNASNITQNYLTDAGDKLAYLTNNSSAVFVNTSINQSGVGFGDTTSNVTVKWYVSLLVRDFNNAPLSGVSASLSNSSGATLASGSSNANGLAIYKFLLQEYFQNGSQEYNVNATNANPHTVSASPGGYQPYNAAVNFTSNANYTAVLNPLGGGSNPATPTPTSTPNNTATPSPASNTTSPAPKTTITATSTPTAAATQTPREENKPLLEIKRTLEVVQSKTTPGAVTSVVKITGTNKGTTPLRTVVLQERIPIDYRGPLPEDYPNVVFKPRPSRIEEGSVIVTWLFENVGPQEEVTAGYEVDGVRLSEKDLNSTSILPIASGAKSEEPVEKFDYTQLMLAFTLVLAGATAFYFKYLKT